MKAKTITLYILFFFIVFIVNAQNIKEIQMFRSGDFYSGDQFGYSADIDNNIAIVGASKEDEDENGINTISNSGSAYFFEKNNNVWSQVQKVKAPDLRQEDYFGYSVSVSGNFAVIGARQNDFSTSNTDSIAQAGAVYLFFNNNGNWEFFQKITATTRVSNEYFGSVVQISGNYLFVGSCYHKYDGNELNPINGAGAVLVYKFNGTQWVFHQKVTAPVRILSSLFGYNFQYADSLLFVGAWEDKTDESNSGSILGAGSAYIFKHNSTTDQFDFVQKIIAPDRAEYDRFGSSISGNQDFVIVSARYDDKDQNGGNILNNAGSVYVFKNNDGNWSFFQKFVAPDRRVNDELGRNVKFENNSIYISVPYNDYDENDSNYIDSTGALYLFSLNQNQTSFDFKQKFIPSDRSFGSYFSVSLAIQNNYILAGSSGTNKMYYLYVDNISPIPDVSTLPDITAECEVTSLTAPTATDNYSGTITGTHNATLPITTQGTTLVTWTYDDGNGNISTQTQNVVIEDVTNPTINCIADQTIHLNSGETFYTIQGTEFDPLSSDDNCGVANILNDFNSSSTLENAQLPIGTTTITWSITDNAENTNTCSFNVLVDNALDINHFENNVIIIYPNPVSNELNIQIDGNSEKLKFEIFNSIGQIVFSGNIINKTTVNTSHFSAGIYIIKIENENTFEFEKILKD